MHVDLFLFPPSFGGTGLHIFKSGASKPGVLLLEYTSSPFFPGYFGGSCELFAWDSLGSFIIALPYPFNFRQNWNP
jgi:hypothetical protein